MERGTGPPAMAEAGAGSAEGAEEERRAAEGGSGSARGAGGGCPVSLCPPARCRGRGGRWRLPCVGCVCLSASVCLSVRLGDVARAGVVVGLVPLGHCRLSLSAVPVPGAALWPHGFVADSR